VFNEAWAVFGRALRSDRNGAGGASSSPAPPTERPLRAWHRSRSPRTPASRRGRSCTVDSTVECSMRLDRVDSRGGVVVWRWPPRPRPSLRASDVWTAPWGARR